MLKRLPTLPALLCLFQAAVLGMPAPCLSASLPTRPLTSSSASPTSRLIEKPHFLPAADIRTQSILPPEALSFQAQQAPASSGLPSWFSEDLTVHGTRRRLLPPPDHPFLRQYDDGHAEGRVPLWKDMTIHMQFGEDTKHDPVTGSYIAPFGEAYRLSNPLKQR